MSKLTPGKVIGAVAATAAVGLAGYALWFDYERRHNPEFRRRLLRDQYRQRRAAEVQNRRAQASQQDALRNAVRDLRNEGPFQGSADEKEGYFLEQVAMGEALAARGKQDSSFSRYRDADKSLALTASRSGLLHPGGNFILQSTAGLSPASGQQHCLSMSQTG